MIPRLIAFLWYLFFLLVDASWISPRMVVGTMVSAWSSSSSSSPSFRGRSKPWISSSLCQQPSSSSSSSSSSPKVYRYFGFGSNVLPSTMENLRGIYALNATAAILPGYQLRFVGGFSTNNNNNNYKNNNNRLAVLEPSAAVVVPCTNRNSATTSNNTNQYTEDVSRTLPSAVHGVMYTLTADDFAKVGWTEGVPMAYRWQRCEVYPYAGRPGEDVGFQAWQDPSSTPCEAYTLVSPNPPTRNDDNHDNNKKEEEEDVPPSSSYLDIIQRGARYWNLDASYQDQLARIPTAKNLLLPGGLSGPLFQFAELFSKTRKRKGTS